MTVSYKRLYRHVRQVLGADISPELGLQEVVDLAQEWLVGTRSWRFLQRREVFLSPRGRLTLSGATWNQTTLALTKTAAFADYVWLQGDTLQVTGGTGVTLGRAPIASRDSADQITLTKTIKASAATDVAGTVELFTIDLPADFRDKIALDSTQGNTDGVDWVSPALLNQLRSLPIVTDGPYRWKVAIDYIGPPRRPILSLYPTPSQNQLESLRLIYSAGITRAGTADPDSTLIDVPQWYEVLLVETVRAFALGYEPTKKQTLSALLDALVRGPIYMGAVFRDNDTQDFYGQLRNGAAQRVNRGRNALFTEPGGPS